jgi:flagellar export protein FliJ
MSRDPLAPLLRVRELQVNHARRSLADRRAGAAEAAKREEAARRAISSELSGGYGFADAFAAWLPVARERADKAAGETTLAEQAVEAARSALAAERAGARTVELLIERRALEARRLALRKSQSALDEAAQRRR